MAKNIMIHSFRRGTGRSTLIVNMAALLAAEGKKIAVIDANIQSPGLHILFNVREDQITCSFNDYLFGKCPIHQTVCHADGLKGEVFLIPASPKAEDIAKVLKHPPDTERISEGLQELTEKLSPDLLLIDSQSGINEDSLYFMGLSDTLITLMRPDRQDYHGTAIITDIARKLNVPEVMLVVNEVPATFNADEVKGQTEQAYQCNVAAVLPHYDEMAVLGSRGIFVLTHPNSPLTDLYKQIAGKLIEP
jgi:MinD-like ATPase involved in chromosome partitioning or flagellar assembly